MNTPSNKVKAQFFALYIRQTIQKYTHLNDFLPVDPNVTEDSYLQLRTVDQLTDEEYINVCHIDYGGSGLSLAESDYIEAGKEAVNNFERDIYLYQYLIRIGILLPFTYLSEDNKPITLSPSDLIGFGWVKMEK